MDEGWLIRLSRVLDFQLILVGQSVGNRTAKGSRIVFFPILARVCQPERRSVAAVDFFGLPDCLIESPATAVQSVRVVILRKLVFNAADRESTLGNSVAITPDQGAEVWRAADVIV